MSGSIRRERIVAIARTWLDTPYRHQASSRGAGCDCLGLVRGVWRALYGAEPESIPPYTPDWAERGGGEALALAARRWLVEVDCDHARSGDVVLFRISPDAPAKHAAIVSEPSRLIHAYWGRAVAETAFGPWWRSRLAFAFSFPGVLD